MMIMFSVAANAQITGDITVVGDAVVVSVEEGRVTEYIAQHQNSAVCGALDQKIDTKVRAKSSKENRWKSTKSVVVLNRENKAADYIKVTKNTARPKSFIRSSDSDKELMNGHGVHFSEGTLITNLHLISPICSFIFSLNNSLNTARSYAYSSGYIRFLLSGSNTTRPPPAV